jgi:hypothetical protein
VGTLRGELGSADAPSVGVVGSGMTDGWPDGCWSVGEGEGPPASVAGRLKSGSPGRFSGDAPNIPATRATRANSTTTPVAAPAAITSLRRRPDRSTKTGLGARRRRCGVIGSSRARSVRARPLIPPSPSTLCRPSRGGRRPYFSACGPGCLRTPMQVRRVTDPHLASRVVIGHNGGTRRGVPPKAAASSARPVMPCPLGPGVADPASWVGDPSGPPTVGDLRTPSAIVRLGWLVLFVHCGRVE